MPNDASDSLDAGDSAQEPRRRAKLSAPRWTITADQLRALNEVFETVKAPSRGLVQSLAGMMGVNGRQARRPFLTHACVMGPPP